MEAVEVVLEEGRWSNTIKKPAGRRVLLFYLFSPVMVIRMRHGRLAYENDG